MAIKYVCNNEDLIKQIAHAVFGSDEDIRFTEEFVPKAGRIPAPKRDNFSQFLTYGPKYLWAVFPDDSTIKPVGFILIADRPHFNSIGFGINKRFSKQGLMSKAWLEIKNSPEWNQVTFPLFGNTSQRNIAANKFLQKIGFKFLNGFEFMGEPSNHYEYS